MRLFYNYFTLQMTDIYLPLLVGGTVYFAPDAVSSSPMRTSVPPMFRVSLYTFMVVTTDHEPSEYIILNLAVDNNLG